MEISARSRCNWSRSRNWTIYLGGQTLLMILQQELVYLMMSIYLVPTVLFRMYLGTETWVEAWQGAAGEACGAPVAPHDGTATATYDYSAGAVTINGAGAFLRIGQSD